jgi:protein involved in temperature-dependent protein secretion
MILLSGCGATTVPGDAGCEAYAEARLARPSAASVVEVPHAWAAWIADLDDRMTGVCR